MSSAFEKLLHSFGKSVGIPDLCPDANGYCCLSFDEEFIHMEYNDVTHQLFLSSNVGSLPAGDRTRLYESLLEANYFFRNTKGATLSIDIPSEHVVLVYQTPIESLDDHRFECLIENFLTVTEEWRSKIADEITPKSVFSTENSSHHMELLQAIKV